MIGITGNMSGGKTYTAVEIMLQRLRSSHRIITNVKLNCQGVTSYLCVPCVYWKRYYYYLENDDEITGGFNCLPLKNYNDYPTGSPRGSADYNERKVFIFYDEISSVFDSMTSSSDGGVQAVATWARHSEKRGQMIYLIMQFASELHKRLRVHITEYIHCTNSSSVLIPFIGCHLPKFLQGKIVRTHYMADAETRAGDNSWSVLNPDVYKCYNTGQIVIGHKTDDILPPLPKLDDTDLNYTRFLRGVFLLWLLIIISFCTSLLMLL